MLANVCVCLYQWLGAPAPVRMQTVRQHINCMHRCATNQTLDLGQMYRSKPLAAVEMTFAALSLHARKQNKKQQVSIDAFILSIDTIESD